MTILRAPAIFAIGTAMQPIGPGAGDQHIFADEIK
jgi:hypothetical protein